jgi:Ca2+-binding EF-hand superfamily protein
VKELKNKIELTFIPNKKYETILYDQFRHFDINSSGTCTLQNFIKVNQRLGVVLDNMSYFEKIFLFFAKPNTSLLFYKEFVKEIFYFTSVKDIKERQKNKLKKKPSIGRLNFIEILTKNIFDKKGIYTLLDLLKNIKIIDYEGIRTIPYNEFIQVLKKLDICLSEAEKEKIFLDNDYFSNGMVKYEVLLNLILEQFWDERKNHLCEHIYYLLTNNGKKYISINTIQKILENNLGNNYSKRKILHFIEEYKLINNNSITPVSLKGLKSFLKYYNFGDCTESVLREFMSIIKCGINDDININNYNYNKCKYNSIQQYFNEPNCINKNHTYSKSLGKYNYIMNKNELYKLIRRLRKIFAEYGRKSFFNFIKQFKYYENDERQIDRNNFRNVFKSFNINLTREDIDIIYNKFSTDSFKNLIYYEDFLKYITVNSSNRRREAIIKFVYDTIIERSEKFNRDLDIKFLKEIYNSKNNFFIKDESDNNLEFIDCLELYHYCYKSFKSNHFCKKEFIEFYRFISFLIYSDDDFINLISNEWRISPNTMNNFLMNINDYYFNDNKKDNYENNKRTNIYNNINIKNEFLLDLKNALLKKGIKGLVNLHWKFLVYCSNVSKITLNDFINVLQLEHINFEKKEFEDIFNNFSLKNNYLDYNRFIRFFKRELNDNKLKMVEKIFLSLKYDTGDNEEIAMNDIKKRYKARRHPEVIIGKKTEDEKIMEFGDSFDINYEITSVEKTNSKIGKFIDFDIFANYYEYVSFIYPDDDDFVNLLISTWC